MTDQLPLFGHGAPPDPSPATGTRDELTLEDITEIANRQGLAKYKWPEYLELMDTLPLSPAGKIKRPALRDTVLNRIEATGTNHGR